MKTAISVPDALHERVEQVAKEHGLTRSRFYALAAERYADALESTDVTAAIDAVIDAVGVEMADSATFARTSWSRLMTSTEAGCRRRSLLC